MCTRRGLLPGRKTHETPSRFLFYLVISSVTARRISVDRNKKTGLPGCYISVDVFADPAEADKFVGEIRLSRPPGELKNKTGRPSIPTP